MSKLYFYTPTTLDEAFIFTMGASVKEGSNPIGEFGTGLKYAIAVTLRLGGRIEIETDQIQYRFVVVQEQVRNTEMGFIYCHRIHKEKGALPELRCPMTTQYGKTWEPWMVMRELYSNTKDENGIVWDSEELVEKDLHENWTLITVEHDEVYDAWQTRNSYILNTNLTPMLDNKTMQIFNRSSNALFYRGIRVSPNPIASRLTYNMTYKTVRLTEDRTMDTGMYGNSIIYAMTHCKDVELLSLFFDQACILDSFESKMPFSAYTLGSDTTTEYAEAACEAIDRNPIFAPSSLKDSVHAYRRERNPESIYRPVKLNEIENERFTICIDLLSMIGLTPKDYTLYFTDDMSSEHYGSAFHKKGIIVLNRMQTVNHDNWKRQTIKTLIEEYVHLRFSAQDYSTAMQEGYNDIIYDIATLGSFQS